MQGRYKEGFYWLEESPTSGVYFVSKNGGRWTFVAWVGSRPASAACVMVKSLWAEMRPYNQGAELRAALIEKGREDLLWKVDLDEASVC